MNRLRGEQSSQQTELIDKVFETPVRFGWASSLAWITNNFGISAFGRLEPDLRAKDIGTTGVLKFAFAQKLIRESHLPLLHEFPACDGCHWGRRQNTSLPPQNTTLQ